MFCDTSGQRVSVEKSSILFSKNTPTHLKGQIVQASGLKETRDLGIYLGVPLTCQHPKAKHYQYLINKVRAKLTSWKNNQLSFAGRVTLTKSVLEALPTYAMMSSRIPIKCIKEIHKIRINFI